jgi:predicted ABC-type ATPase
VKDIVILGGPNGAGKTTAARVLLPSRVRLNAYINADEIARRISPRNPDAVALQAGRSMLGQIENLIASESSFAFETTCAGRSYIKLLQSCKQTGWRVSLIFLWVPSPDYSVARVARRISQGGHAIPEDTIRRRYRVGLWNMRHLYLPLADEATIYDNRDNALRLIARREAPFSLEVWDGDIWARIEEETGRKP